MHMLWFSAPKGPSKWATLAVPIQRLLSTNGRGSARICEEIDCICRWPWMKCQVDRPSGGWRSNHSRRTTPGKLEGHLEIEERRAGSRKTRSHGWQGPTALSLYINLLVCPYEGVLKTPSLSLLFYKLASRIKDDKHPALNCLLSVYDESIWDSF